MQTRHASGDLDVRVEHVKGRQFRWFNVFMVVVMSLGSLGYGLSASIIGTTLSALNFSMAVFK